MVGGGIVGGGLVEGGLVGGGIVGGGLVEGGLVGGGMVGGGGIEGKVKSTGLVGGGDSRRSRGSRASAEDINRPMPPTTDTRNATRRFQTCMLTSGSAQTKAGRK